MGDGLQLERDIFQMKARSSKGHPLLTQIGVEFDGSSQS